MHPKLLHNKVRAFTESFVAELTPLPRAAAPGPVHGALGEAPPRERPKRRRRAERVVEVIPAARLVTDVMARMVEPERVKEEAPELERAQVPSALELEPARQRRQMARSMPQGPP